MLIGTAVVGATTMIFSIIVMLTKGLTVDIDKLSLLHPPFLLGLVIGGAVIYWFTGASMQAVTTGAYRAVEFIKKNIKLDSAAEKASVADSKKVVEICTQYAQKGMFNIFLVVFFSTLAFACFEPFFFIGYLISIALFGLYQAIFMANAGGAWDNAKKVVEVELKEKGTDAARRDRRRRHRRRPVQGHLVGGDEPGHQVHHPVRPARRRAGGRDERRRPGQCSPTCWRSASSPSRWSSSGAASTGCGSTRRTESGFRLQMNRGPRATGAFSFPDGTFRPA